MEAQSLLLQDCFNEAAALSRRALERCLDNALEALQEAESAAVKLAERDEIAQAWSSLQKQRARWGERYAASLLAAFQAAPDAAGSARYSTSGFAALGPISTDFASLTLVDDAQVSQNIEFARLAQQFHLQVDAVMADFDALMSSAQGLTSVQPERNPLRPEVFSRALGDLLDSASADPLTRGLWLKHLAKPMGKELRTIYETLVGQLEGAHVQAVSYRVMPVPSGSGRGGGRSGGGGTRGQGGGPAAPSSREGGNGNGNGNGNWNGGGAGGSGGWQGESHGEAPPVYADPSQGDVKESLLRDFMAPGGGHHQTRLAESYYTRAEEEWQALKAESPSQPGSLPAALPEPPEQALPVVERPVRPVDAQGALSPQLWGAYAAARARKLVHAELKKEATHVGQVLGMEVVRQLVSQVAQDPRLLAPVREAIVALEPSLLRLAMVDPRFFSEDSHPGRRLMERVAQRSFKYNDEHSPEFVEFFAQVREAFNELNALKIESAQVFSSALAKLEGDWARWDRSDDEHRSEALQNLRFAEERQAGADQIAYDMSSRPDLDKVPGVVLDFLFGPWALVMSHARLVDQSKQIDPQGFGRVVSDLVWSVKPDFTLRHPAKLMEMIPGMLRKLHAGLDLIGQDAREREPFFEILMRLHRPVLKLRRLKSERDAHESGVVPLDSALLPASPEQRVPKVAAEPWLAPREQDHAGFEDTLPSGTVDLEEAFEPDLHAGVGALPAAGAESAPAQSEAARVESVLKGLHTGCWVDLFSHQHWLRAQLMWASAKGTLFMFVSHGGRPHSMTRRSCERLVSTQLLRPVASHGVVGHALANLKQDVQAGADTASPGEVHAGLRAEVAEILLEKCT